MSASQFTSTVASFGDVDVPAPIPYDPASWSEIAYYQSDAAPRPVVAHINVYSLLSQSAGEGAGIVARTIELPAGLSFPTTTDANQLDNGRLRFTYGSQRSARRIVCDLKSGSYQLPPSESVRIEVQVNSGAATNFVDPVNVAGALVEGWQAAPARATFSYIGALDPSEQYNNSYPDGARWVAITASATGVGAGEPQIQYRGGPIILMDFVNETFLPPVQPAELFTRYNIEGWELRNLSAVDPIVLAKVRFFLEF